MVFNNKHKYIALIVLILMVTAICVVYYILKPSNPQMRGAIMIRAPTSPIKEAINLRQPVKYYSEEDVFNVAKFMYVKCRNVKSLTEQACVVWVICNRADKYSLSVSDVIVRENSFGSFENAPVSDDLYMLAEDVLFRWSLEKSGKREVGRVLPKEYLYFSGDGERNYFKDKLNGTSDIWDFSLDSPYYS